MTPLPHEFRDLLKSLNGQGVDYMLVGGWAVIHYGYARNTGDIDFWIATTSENADRVILALKEFIGVAPEKRSITELYKTIEFGMPPLRVHMMCEISGAEYEDCRKRKVMTEWDGIPVAVIGFEDLMINKKASGRPKDIADVKWFAKKEEKKTRPKKKKR
ncbi:MAG: nucleotidyltransferase [Phycisphaerales bacterium]|nr:nucleotidyltransferase [Phycisphaerales bacterium]